MVSGWLGSGWLGLGWLGLGWRGLGWVRLGSGGGWCWVGFDVRLGLCRVGLVSGGDGCWVGLGWVLGWVELVSGLGQAVIYTSLLVGGGGAEGVRRCDYLFMDGQIIAMRSLNDSLRDPLRDPTPKWGLRRGLRRSPPRPRAGAATRIRCARVEAASREAHVGPQD